MLTWGAKHDKESRLPELWRMNAEENLEYLDSIGPPPSIHGMSEYISYAVILVGRGESLHKAMKMLKEADREHFVVVSTNSTIRMLLENGVVPNYMIAIDGDPGHWSLKDLPESVREVTGIFAPSVYPQALKDWQGNISVIPMGAGNRKLRNRISRLYGPILMAGGNAINTAAALFLFRTQVRIFMFVGCNLSFKKRFYPDMPTKEDDQVAFPIKDIYGEDVLTNVPMYQYKLWMEQIASQFYPEWAFYNCSEGILGTLPGGGHMKEFRYMPLDMAVSEVREALDYERANGGFYRVTMTLPQKRGDKIRVSLLEHDYAEQRAL